MSARTLKDERADDDTWESLRRLIADPDSYNEGGVLVTSHRVESEDPGVEIVKVAIHEPPTP